MTNSFLDTMQNLKISPLCVPVLVVQDSNSRAQISKGSIRGEGKYHVLQELTLIHFHYGKYFYNSPWYAALFTLTTPVILKFGPGDGVRPNCGRNMAALIEEEGLDENGQPIKCRRTTHRQSKRKVKPHKTNVNSGKGHDDDENYSGSHSDDGSGSSLKDDSDIEMISKR
jgi:hypothetical protein